MPELSWQAKYQLEVIEKATAELRKEVLRLEAALDEQSGVVQQLKPYPLEEVVRRSYLRGYSTPEAARAAAEQAYGKSLSVAAENAAIIDNNKRVAARLVQLIKNAGLPDKVSIRRPRSRFKTDSVETDWAQAIRTQIPTGDQWPMLKDGYDQWLRQCDAWRRDLDAEVAAKKEAEKASRRTIANEALRQGLNEKYGTGDLDLVDLKFNLLDKNKYLRLASFLRRNRGDWSDGCDFARMGLDGFKAESDLDRSIALCIRECCVDFEDGRVFRDCEWNYDRLFAMAKEQNSELYADYTKIEEACE